MADHNNDVYVWRFPNWLIWGLVLLLFGPLCTAQAYHTYLVWDFDPLFQLTLLSLCVGMACLSGWWLSMISIRITRTEVRFMWPFKLRREDVVGYEIVRTWGLEWVYIRRRRGFAYTQLLNMPGQSEFRRRLLEWLQETEPAGPSLLPPGGA
jgi:hypothetical protein